MIRILPVVLLFSVHYLFGQDASIFKPDSIKKEVEAVQITSNLRIDGALNEEEWKRVKPSPRFTQVEPNQGAAPRNDTEIKALYNNQYLYIGIVAHDSLGKEALRAIDFKRDFNPMQHDVVGLSFDGFNDKRNATSFLTTPYGLQRDLLSFDDLYYDADWDGLWRVRTSRTDSGWVAEIAIPWQTLRYRKSADTVQNWGFNVYRNRRLTNEITAFSPYPRSFTYLRMDYAGVLKNLRPPPPRPNIRISPYFLTSYDRYQNFGSGTGKPPDQTQYKIGGDVKWAINPNAVLDLTANTDFAQADADQAVNNVSMFSVFFPERRQFFLENASLFGFGISQALDGSGGLMRLQPFFSRKIGLDDDGNPIPIDAGARYVYRSLERNYGGMLIRQQAPGAKTSTDFFVGRYSENLGAQNRIGGMTTIRNGPTGTDVSGTVDGFFRWKEANTLNAMGVYSRSAGGGTQGFAGIAQYYYSINQGKIWWTESLVTQNFDPAMGFVSRKDVIGTTPGADWFYRGKYLPFPKILRAFEPGWSPEFYFQASTGKFIESDLLLYPIWLNFQNGGFFGYSVNPVFQRLTSAFEPLGVRIDVGNYHYTQQQIFIGTDPSRKLNGRLIYTWGGYFNGNIQSGDWEAQFAPSPYFSVIGKFNRNSFREVGVDKITSTVDLYSINARLALNPRVQLIGFFQKNSENASSNYNIRLSWEYEPLSYVYLVYNRQSFESIQLKAPTEDHAIAKISLLKQF